MTKPSHYLIDLHTETGATLGDQERQQVTIWRQSGSSHKDKALSPGDNKHINNDRICFCCGLLSQCVVSVAPVNPGGNNVAQ